MRVGGSNHQRADVDDADEAGKASEAKEVESRSGPRSSGRAGGCLPSKPAAQTKRAKSMDMGGSNLMAEIEAKIAAMEAKEKAAAAKGKDLGILSDPGKELRRQIEAMKPGETLRFTTFESATCGLGKITVTPPGALDIDRKSAGKGGPLGGSSPVEYTITMPKDAKPGERAKVTTEGKHQVRDDKDWAFSFEVKTAKP